MKKIITLLLIAFSSFANAQFFEGFESGVPGTMEQNYIKGETTFIDFGLSALNVDNALSETNSAVFFNTMETTDVATSLQTPVLNLTNPDLSLEFKYSQKEKTSNYANILSVELSNDAGVTWQQIVSCDSTVTEMTLIHVDLATFSPSETSIIRFNCKQINSYMGYPIVIDDISIKDHTVTTGRYSKNKASTTSHSDIVIYPNPSNGIFNITTNQSINLSIIDSNGRTVYTLEQITADTIINLSQFASGIYFAKINSNDNQQVKKLIIE